MSENLRTRYDFSLRARAAELFAEGRGYRSAATLLGLPPTTVRQWHRTYVALGIGGLSAMGKKHKTYHWELKVAAAKAVVEDGEPKADVMARCGIASLSPLESWCRAYREGGADALRPLPMARPWGPPPLPMAPTLEEELRRRIAKLEAENAYLKKSIALRAEKRSRTARSPRP